ncbi:MAG: outer membrane beta-barrel protein [Gammaproteobacteria bacterium]|nr:outer membrane beta-barrel protein [Gammaproteobacteria bacterium]
MKFLSYLVLLFILATNLTPTTVYSDTGDLSIGAHANIVGGRGKPSNDILGIGIIANYSVSNQWFMDIELIYSEADFERPWKPLGLVQDPTEKTIDAVFTSTALLFHFGQNIQMESKTLKGYWTAGIGFNSVDVEDVTGPLDGGGTFNIITDPDTETLIGLKTGIRQRLGDNWSANYALRFDYHLADWKVTDTISATTTSIGNYSTYGFLVGVTRKF